jgi:hypothetical protein
MLNLPYLLDCLAEEEINAHNAQCAPADRVADPIPDAIMAINEWLHWYRKYRLPEPDEDDVAQLTAMGKALLSTLERVFPFKVRVGRGGEYVRSMWCNEKIHSILHAPRTLVRMGRSQNVCCQVTETRHKGVKRKGSRTNRNPGTSGMSIMKTELKEAACQRMADALDETGLSEFKFVSVCICLYHVCIHDVSVSICLYIFHFAVCASMCISVFSMSQYELVYLSVSCCI